MWEITKQKIKNLIVFSVFMVTLSHASIFKDDRNSIVVGISGGYTESHLS